jgi:hypothetical protein
VETKAHSTRSDSRKHLCLKSAIHRLGVRSRKGRLTRVSCRPRAQQLIASELPMRRQLSAAPMKRLHQCCARHRSTRNLNAPLQIQQCYHRQVLSSNGLNAHSNLLQVSALSTTCHLRCAKRRCKKPRHCPGHPSQTSRLCSMKLRCAQNGPSNDFQVVAPCSRLCQHQCCSKPNQYSIHRIPEAYRCRETQTLRHKRSSNSCGAFEAANP